MKVVKGLALSLLSFLLFLSLSLFGIALTLNNTILNPDFTISEIDKLDVPSLAGEFFEEQAAGAIPEGLDFITPETIRSIIADAEPWIEEQTDIVVRNGYDYLLGKSESLSVTISTEPLLGILKSNLWQALLASPPPEAAGLSPAAFEEQFNVFFQEFSQQLPSTFEFDKSSIPPEVLTQLEQARQYINYFQTGYKALIGFMALLLLGIILIYHEVRGATRGLGITFLTYGAIEYGGILAAKHFALPQLPLSEIPPSLQPWLLQFFSDLLHPLEMFSIGLLIGGIVLLIVSFVYKPSQPSF